MGTVLLALSSGIVAAVVTQLAAFLLKLADRRREDRERARPTVSTIADQFVAIQQFVDRARRRSSMPGPDFEEAFQEFWDGAVRPLDRAMLEVQDDTLRRRLQKLSQVLDVSWAAWHLSPFKSHELLVTFAAEAGSELSAAYLRGQKPDDRTLYLFGACEETLNAWFESEEELDQARHEAAESDPS